MNIEFVEIQNFRRLKSIRIDLTKKTTLFVGANNSGKTSAMIALRQFLISQNDFTTNDFTLSSWPHINNIGATWEEQSAQPNSEIPSLNNWEGVLPSMDVWLRVGDTELHHVKHLLPTLDWKGGLLGVRLRFEPKDIGYLYKDYLVATKAAKETKKAAQKTKNSEYKLTLWPRVMMDFLQRRLRAHFGIRAYTLDPTKYKAPLNGVAQPQLLPSESEPIDGDPFKGLMRIDEINAQRGFTDVTSSPVDHGDGQEALVHRENRKLSEQLRSYYMRHLDPAELPEPSDLDALQAIEIAQGSFDEKLELHFSDALKEVQNLGYPGISDPKLKISTRVRPTDGLSHDAAVQYEVISSTGEMISRPLYLPEQYNGLGYQNLISMIFKLLSFRDGWMQIGKASKRALLESTEAFSIPPLHLVLVEEPEAHLHAQVQQVFIRKAYDVLRKHSDLGDKTTLQTQLLVSTHSSHIAHECKFSSLRYFRRVPADGPGSAPTSAVVNLSEVFGENNGTEEFVTRYLKATHCDLFFADAAILVEGPAERMLVPHFIRNHFPTLTERYITLLEIGGSHAHRLRPLIEHLGLITLVITDLDAAESTGKQPAIPAAQRQERITRNPTLSKWHPKKNLVDDLLTMSGIDKVKKYDSLFSVRIAYQCPVLVQQSGASETVKVSPNTFEDALVFENLSLFKDLSGDGLIKQFRDAINEISDLAKLGITIIQLLKSGDKAKLALDLLCELDPKKIHIPFYIKEGLSWLDEQLQCKQQEVSQETFPTAPGEGK